MTEAEETVYGSWTEHDLLKEVFKVFMYAINRETWFLMGDQRDVFLRRLGMTVGLKLEELGIDPIWFVAFMAGLDKTEIYKHDDDTMEIVIEDCEVCPGEALTEEGLEGRCILVEVLRGMGYAVKHERTGPCRCRMLVWTF